MTKDEWLSACRRMQEPLMQLMGIAHRMNISGPITIAINRDGMSWAETREAGHLYEFDVMPDDKVNVRLDGNSLTATPDGGMTVKET